MDGDSTCCRTARRVVLEQTPGKLRLQDVGAEAGVAEELSAEKAIVTESFGARNRRE